MFKKTLNLSHAYIKDIFSRVTPSALPFSEENINRMKDMDEPNDTSEDERYQAIMSPR